VETRSQRPAGQVVPIVIACVLALAFVATPLALHFAQKRHDRLDFDVEAAYPAGGPAPRGQAFADTLAALVDHELRSPMGWRPNDFVLWGPGLWADNNANRQLGIIQAVRESVRVFRDNLTKVSGTEYDPNLVDADTRLRNDERKFWFPSAERRFGEGVESLRLYVTGLRAEPPTSKSLNRRNVEAIRLFTAWTDLLGGAHAALVDEQVGFFRSDDVYYHAQGLAHVIHHGARALRREYETELQGRGTVLELLDRVVASLGRASRLKPLMVLDGSPDGLFANHRRNLDAYLVDARQLLYSVREELEK
jgi:hypothetical protein